jgi:hypothetical protein
MTVEQIVSQALDDAKRTYEALRDRGIYEVTCRCESCTKVYAAFANLTEGLTLFMDDYNKNLDHELVRACPNDRCECKVHPSDCECC